jgi:hypothetical protein
MKEILKNILSFVLVIGIIFITSDFEVYFGEINHTGTSTTIPVDKTSDVEHTNSAHHAANDFFSETILYFPKPTVRVSFTIGLILPSLNPIHYSYIWQPPKFS